MIFEQGRKIQLFHTDATGSITLASLCRFAQESAGGHAERLGFGMERLAGKNMAWVLREQGHARDAIPRTGRGVADHDLARHGPKGFSAIEITVFWTKAGSWWPGAPALGSGWILRQGVHARPSPFFIFRPRSCRRRSLRGPCRNCRRRGTVALRTSALFAQVTWMPWGI